MFAKRFVDDGLEPPGLELSHLAAPTAPGLVRQVHPLLQHHPPSSSSFTLLDLKLLQIQPLPKLVIEFQ